MPTLKRSQFNHVVKVPGEDAWALYNFATGQLDVLDEPRKATFTRALELPSSSTDVMAWKRLGFLTSADELAVIRAATVARARAVARGRAGRALRFTIAATSACNMGCPYCFQARSTGHMNADVQDAFMDLVAWRLEHERHDCLKVIWFGGEPLLAPDVIERISNRLIGLAAKHAIPYSAIIATNGYLLDQAAAEHLERLHVKQATVSVDGNQQTHDASRPLAGGGPSYERIMENLASLHTGIGVSVRCNLHRGNADCLQGLIAQVRNISARTGTRMWVSPIRVKAAPNNEGRTGMVDVFTPAEFDQVLAAAGIPPRQRSLSPRPSPCQAVNLDGLYVDAEGGVFPQCTFMATKSDAALGNVVSWGGKLPDDWDKITQRVIDKLLFPADSPKCLACKLLPCCWGRCPEERSYAGDISCPPGFEDPDSLVLTLLMQRRQNKKTGRSTKLDSTGPSGRGAYRSGNLQDGSGDTNV